MSDNEQSQYLTTKYYIVLTLKWYNNGLFTLIFCIKAANKAQPLDEVWELDIDNGVQWNAAPPMSSARSSLTCNLITTSRGNEEIIVVGGNGGSTSVEIFSVNNRVWRAGEICQ